MMCLISLTFKFPLNTYLFSISLVFLGPSFCCQVLEVQQAGSPAVKSLRDLGWEKGMFSEGHQHRALQGWGIYLLCIFLHC